MYKTVFSIGLNDQDKKIQLMSDGRALEVICDAVARNYPDGATLYEARGLYKGVFEKTIRIEVYEEKTDDGARLSFMEECRKALNQESIAYEVAEVNAALYFG